MKILVAERIAEDGVDLLRNIGQVDTMYGLSEEELQNIIAEYDALVVRSVTQVNRALLEKATKLKVVGRAGNGIDNIELDAATEKGVIVVNTPDSNTMAAAELTIGHIFAICRNIPQAHMGAKNKEFRRNKFKGVELNEKTAGIIGVGRIGSFVATRLKGCNMKVVGYDPYITDERFKKLGVERCNTLEELVSQCDIITVHTPKTEETIGMIGKEQFALMKDGVRLVNCARGGIINEADLCEALQTKKVAAAAIDVFVKEPSYELSPEDQDFDHPLLHFDNVIVSPHLGASTEEAQYNVGVTVAKQVAAALEGQMVSNAVNLPSLGLTDLNDMKPYLELVEKLGRLYFQLDRHPINKVEIVYGGEVAEKETGILTLSLLKGLLEPVVKEKVNYVNAKLIAEQRQIEVVESVTSHADRYTNLITLKFYQNDGVKEIKGTVLGKNDIRIVEVFGYHLNVEPSPFILFVSNEDKPGVIGGLGTLLGASRVNIAAMQVSRNVKGDKAMMAINIDGEIAKDVLSLMSNINGVFTASMVKL